MFGAGTFIFWCAKQGFPSAEVAIHYGFTIELFTPLQPQQKGAVENLAGRVKKSFFRARRFADLEHDLPRQLLTL
jgi:transposase